MSKMIEEIEKTHPDNSPVEEKLLAASLSEHVEDISALMDLLHAANKSGVFTLLQALFANKGESMQEIADEISKPQNVRFIRNLMSVYTFLSNIEPEVVTRFMLNLAAAVDNAEEMKEKGTMGLLAIRSQMRDPDVTVGFRVLFEVARGFTRTSKRKE